MLSDVLFDLVDDLKDKKGCPVDVLKDTVTCIQYEQANKDYDYIYSVNHRIRIDDLLDDIHTGIVNNGLNSNVIFHKANSLAQEISQ